VNNNNLSLAEFLCEGIIEAKELHQLSEKLEQDIDWVKLCGAHLAKKLTPLVTAWQSHAAVCPTSPGVSFVVDGEALPPFYNKQTQAEIGSEIANRHHVGE